MTILEHFQNNNPEGDLFTIKLRTKKEIKKYNEIIKIFNHLNSYTEEMHKRDKRYFKWFAKICKIKHKLKMEEIPLEFQTYFKGPYFGLQNEDKKN